MLRSKTSSRSVRMIRCSSITPASIFECSRMPVSAQRRRSPMLQEVHAHSRSHVRLGLTCGPIGSRRWCGIRVHRCRRTRPLTMCTPYGMCCRPRGYPRPSGVTFISPVHDFVSRFSYPAGRLREPAHELSAHQPISGVRGVGGSESKRANVSHATSCAQCGLTCHRVAPRDP